MNTPKQPRHDRVTNDDPNAFQRLHGRKLMRTAWMAHEDELPDQPVREKRMSHADRYFTSLNREERKKILTALHQVRDEQPALLPLLQHLEEDHEDLKVEQGDKKR